MHTQHREEDANALHETLLSQRPTPVHCHGHTWAVAKNNLQQPIRSGHDELVPQANTGSANLKTNAAPVASIFFDQRIIPYGMRAYLQKTITSNL